MLRVCDYDHPSDNDVHLPRGRTIAHANVCMITNPSDNEDTNTHEPAVPVVNVDTNVPSDIYLSCVEALLDDVSNSSSTFFYTHYFKYCR